MCSIKFSKNIVPFAIAFVLGIFVVGAFSCLTSSNKVKTVQVNEVKVYKSEEKKSSCNAEKRMKHMEAMKEAEMEFSSEEIRETRIVEPTFEETIIINEEVKQSRK